MVRGASYRSDLLIDDVLFRPGACQEIPEPPLARFTKSEIKEANEKRATWKPLGTTQKPRFKYLNSLTHRR